MAQNVASSKLTLKCNVITLFAQPFFDRARRLSSVVRGATDATLSLYSTLIRFYSLLYSVRIGGEAVEDERWYTIAEIVNLLKVHEQTVRRWIRNGELRAAMLGRKAGYRVKASDLAAFLEVRTAGTRQTEEK